MICHPRSPRTVAVRHGRAAFALSILLSASPLTAQSIEPETTAHYVPSNVPLYVSFRRLGDMDRSLRQTQLSRFVPLLTGQETKRSEPFSVRRAIQGFLAPDSRIDVDDLMNCEVGVVAPSWTQPGRAIWLIRVPDEEVFQRWFPGEGLQRGAGVASTQVFRAADGTMVCIRNRVAAFARPGGDWAQLGEILRLMAGQGGGALDHSRTYQELAAHLPARPLAILYLSDSPLPSERGDDHSSDTSDERIVGHTIIGVYVSGSRLDIAMRGTRWSRDRRAPLSSHAVERMLSLPRTTLAAMITSVDWSSPGGLPTESRNDALGRYLRFLGGLSVAGGGESSSPLRVGRHLILAWDQDLRRDGSTPQFAALIESEDSRRLAEAGVAASESLRRLLEAVEGKELGDVLTRRERAHLGVPIHSIPLRDYANESRFSWVRLLGELEPSWAAAGDWFVVTLTRDHLERILDARIGFSSSLVDLPEARALRDNSDRSSALAFLRGDLAANVMERWIAEALAGKASLLNPVTWNGRDPADLFDAGRLGIEMRSDAGPGFVEVIGVEPFTPADGCLRAGDRLLGVDGRLLGFASPEEDLRAWWESAPPATNLTFRVLRGEEIIECTIRRREEDMSLSNLLVKPIDAMRELTAISRSMPFASIRFPATDERHYSALITLRLSDAPPDHPQGLQTDRRGERGDR